MSTAVVIFGRVVFTAALVGTVYTVLSKFGGKFFKR